MASSQKFYPFLMKIIFLKCPPLVLAWNSWDRQFPVRELWGLGLQHHTPTAQKLGAEVSPGEQGSLDPAHGPQVSKGGRPQSLVPLELAGSWLFPQSWIQRESVLGLQTGSQGPTCQPPLSWGADTLKDALRGVRVQGMAGLPFFILGSLPGTANSLDLFHPADQGCFHSHITEVVSPVT